MIGKIAAGTLAKVATAALLVALVAAGIQTYRLIGEQRDHAENRRTHADQLAAMERAARQAEADARAEERRRAGALQEIVHETEQNLERARADAAAAADAGERLRQRVAELTAGCRRAAGGSAAPGSGQAASPTADLLADVQRRLDEATDRVARFADEASAAGLACERAYGALTASR